MAHDPCPRGTEDRRNRHCLTIGKPRVDHLRGGIWEVRSRVPTRIGRVLFAVSGDEMVLLHGFMKKTQKTPREDIELAESRWKEWLNAEGK